jgi:hypothetical protein
LLNEIESWLHSAWAKNEHHPPTTTTTKESIESSPGLDLSSLLNLFYLLGFGGLVVMISNNANVSGEAEHLDTWKLFATGWVAACHAPLSARLL